MIADQLQGMAAEFPTELAERHRTGPETPLAGSRSPAQKFGKLDRSTQQFIAVIRQITASRPIGVAGVLDQF